MCFFQFHKKVFFRRFEFASSIFSALGNIKFDAHIVSSPSLLRPRNNISQKMNIREDIPKKILNVEGSHNNRERDHKFLKEEKSCFAKKRKTMFIKNI